VVGSGAIVAEQGTGHGHSEVASGVAPSPPSPWTGSSRGSASRAEGPWGTLIHVRRSREGGGGGGGGGAASVGSTKYADSRVDADIHAAMVGGDG